MQRGRAHRSFFACSKEIEQIRQVHVPPPGFEPGLYLHASLILEH